MSERIDKIDKKVESNTKTCKDRVMLMMIGEGIGEWIGKIENFSRESLVELEFSISSSVIPGRGVKDLFIRHALTFSNDITDVSCILHTKLK